MSDDYYERMYWECQSEIRLLNEENARLREALKNLIKDHEYETSSDEEEDKFFKARSAARSLIREGGND